MNALPPGKARTGRAARPCGQRLTEAPAVELDAFPELLLAQQVFDFAVSGGAQELFGRPTTSVEFFAAVRSLCALILYAAESEDLVDAPQVCASAFAHSVGKRIANDRARGSLAAVGEDARRGRRTRCYGAVPREAGLVAVIAPLALKILMARSGLVHSLAPFVTRAVARNPRYARRLVIDFAFPTELRVAYEASLSDRRFGRRGLLLAPRRSRSGLSRARRSSP